MATVNVTVEKYNGSPYRDLDEFFALHRPKEQVFTVYPDRPRTIISAGGMRIHFPVSPFATATRQLVSYPVQVRLFEFLRKSEMLLGGFATASSGHTLDMPGVFHLEIVDPEQVGLRFSRDVLIELPQIKGTRNAAGAMLLVPSLSTTKTLHAEQQADWKPLGKGRINLVRKEYKQKFYQYRIMEPGTYACGIRFPVRQCRTMLSARCVSLAEELQECRVYLELPACQTLEALLPAGKSQFAGFNLPALEEGRLIGIGMHRGTFFWGSKVLGPLKNRRSSLEMHPVSEAEVVQQIKKMDSRLSGSSFYYPK